MTDIEDRIAVEFRRLAGSAHGTEHVEAFAAELTREGLRSEAEGSAWRRWLIPAVAAVLVAIPIIIVALMHTGGSDRPAPVAAPTIQKASDIVGQDWILLSWRGTDGVSHTSDDPTIDIDLTTVGAEKMYDGCNYYQGSADVSDTQIVLPKTAVSAVACQFPVPPFLALSNSTSSWRLTSGRLIISAPAVGSMTLSESSDPAHLLGRMFSLRTVQRPDGGLSHYTSPKPAYIRFDRNGSVAIEEGCNGADGQVDITPGRMVFHDVVTTTQTCGISLIDSGTVSWTLHAGVLTLTSPAQGTDTFAYQS